MPKQASMEAQKSIKARRPTVNPGIPDEQDFGTLMRRHENTGRPLGDKRFVKKLEALFGQGLLPGRPGRPKKTTKTGKWYGVPNGTAVCSGPRPGHTNPGGQADF